VTSSPDYLTIKYDSAGTLLWMRVYNYAYEDMTRSVTVDDSDNIIVTGYSTDSSQYYNWDWCTIKYRPNGDTVWAHREDVGRDDRAYSVTVDRYSNGVLVAGGLGTDGTIVKYDGTTGSEIWRRSFNWVGLIVGISTDNNHNIYFTSLYTPPGSWFGDFLVMKCDSFGDSLWATTYDGGYDDGTRGIVVDKFGSVIVFGASMDGYPGSQPPEQADYVTIKYSPTTDFEEISPNVFPSQYKLNQNFPNPFNGNTTIQYEISTISNVNLKIYDILGREVKTLVDEFQVAGPKTVSFDASGLPSGVYFYRLHAWNTSASSGLGFTSVKKMVIAK
jgi:hypothetical protein